MKADSESSDASQPGSSQEAEISTPQPTRARGDPQHISLVDAFGDRREGDVLRAMRWDDATAADIERRDGDFSIVILSEPPEGSPQVPPGTVVCAPAPTPWEQAAVREAAVTYEHRTWAPRRSWTAAEVKLLRGGKLYAATELTITPELVFKSGKPHLELLARDLLICQATAGYLTALAVALTAPDAPRRGSYGELMSALGQILSNAQAALRKARREAEPEPVAALDRLSRLAAAEEGGPFLAPAHELYPQVTSLAEDVYLVRALEERLPDALAMLAMRAFVREAAVPPTDHDLALDKAIVMEQLQFASLVAEPHRRDTARSALDHFQQSYRKRYESHHWAYWTEMARLRTRLLEAKGYTEALRKLNTLTELGPPVGEVALEGYQELLKETSDCSPIVGIEDQLGDAAICTDCGLRLDQDPFSERALETLTRVERAIERQMVRLSSVAVRQVLERSGDARVERFLRVIQAAQLSSLPEVLDDELVGYLRRFLVEARIGSLLNPIMSRLEEGGSPDVEDAQEALRELARVLDRAFRASARSLPPPKPAIKSGSSKRSTG